MLRSTLPNRRVAQMFLWFSFVKFHFHSGAPVRTDEAIRRDSIQVSEIRTQLHGQNSCASLNAAKSSSHQNGSLTFVGLVSFPFRCARNVDELTKSSLTSRDPRLVRILSCPVSVIKALQQLVSSLVLVIPPGGGGALAADLGCSSVKERDSI